MSGTWPAVRLGDVLVRSEQFVDLVPTEQYKEVTIRLWGKGVVLRGIVTGSDIAAARRIVVRAGQFIFSRIDARNGALGLVPDDLDGAVVSSDFPAYNLVEARLDCSFMNWLSRTAQFVDLCRAASEGTTNRVRLQEDRFLGMSISLPSLSEQRRIVAKIEQLASKIEEARALRKATDEECDRLLIAMAHRDDVDAETKRSIGWRDIELSEVISLVRDELSVEPSANYPNVGIYSFGRGLFGKPPINGLETSAAKLNRIHAGQFVYSRLFAFEGSYGMVPQCFDGCYVSNEYPTFDCNPALVNAEFLWAYFRSPAVWSRLAAGSVGLGDRRQRVQPSRILEHRLLLPPIEYQRQIAYLQAKVDQLKALQAQTAAELDALLPSILDRAFRGEL